MAYYADIYVIEKHRRKDRAIAFLDHFVPNRNEGADEYLIPQYSDDPLYSFSRADEVMSFLESNPTFAQSLYWQNLDEESLNSHGMVFYTKDGCIIFGISRAVDMDDHTNTVLEDEGLNQMKAYFNTALGYIHYESPPAASYEKFTAIVKELE